MGLVSKFRKKKEINLKYNPKMTEDSVKDSPFLGKLTVDDFKDYI